jgi:hypothetical protein
LDFFDIREEFKTKRIKKARLEVLERKRYVARRNGRKQELTKAEVNYGSLEDLELELALKTCNCITWALWYVIGQL